jgi:hypothetical protein
VGVRKEATQRTEQVQDTVRREELEVKDGRELVGNSGTALDERQRRLTANEGSLPSDLPRSETLRRP